MIIRFLSKKRFIIALLPGIILVYSFFIFLFLIKKDISLPIIIPINTLTNIFEILIPLFLGFIMIIQFKYFYKIRKREIENLNSLKKKLDEAEQKIKTLKKENNKAKNKINENLELFLNIDRNSQFKVINIFSLIELELIRLMKKHYKGQTLNKKDLMYIINYLISQKIIKKDFKEDFILIKTLRNKAAHGKRLDKIEIEFSQEFGKDMLSELKRIK